MNRAFRIIWSHTRQAFVVADELASARGKRNGSRLLLAAAGTGLLATAAPAIAGGPCPGQTTISTVQNFACSLNAGDELTLTPTGSISVSGEDAISSSSGFASINNSGTIQSNYQTAIKNVGGVIGSIHNQLGGLIDGAEGGISLENSSVSGSIVNAGRIQAGRDAIQLTDGSSIAGNIVNSGHFQAGDDAIEINNSSITGNIINSGSIVAQDDGIVLGDATLSGDLRNEGRIDSGYWALNIYESEIVGNIVNSGTIEGDLIGIKISGGNAGNINNSGTISGGEDGILLGEGSYTSIGLITNSGTIKGTNYALRIVSASLDGLHIEGNDTARLLGDVYLNDDVLVKSGAVFSSTNAFEVDSFTIAQNATLNMGVGTSSSGDLAEGFSVSDGFFNNGTLALASGVTGSIHGDYTQSANGTLKIGVADNTTFGKLVVDGTAELASNAKIAVNVSNPNYSFSVDSLQDVLSAGTLNSDGTFAVSDNSLLFDFGAVKDGNTVDLTISAAAKPGIGLIEDIVTGLGNTPAVGAAKVLDQAIIGNPSGELAGHFVGLTNEQQVSAAVTQTLPTVAGSTSNAISDTLSSVNRVVQARQASNSGLSSGDAVADDNLWIKTFGAWAEQDERNAISGYDANTQGLAIGSDAAVSEHSRLGLAFAYAQTNLDSDSHVAPQSADIDTFQLIGYGSYTLDANTELNFQLDGGQNRVDSTRKMPFASATAKADYDGYNLHAGVGIGHSLRLSEQLTFIPSARADYTWIESESYREKGAGALDLDVDSNDAEELLLSVDGKLDYRITEASVISANLGAGYDVIDEDSAITSTYAGAPGAAF
ncbi:autotransporter domain-containing protein, partial [Aquipseudomonas alcaligenes]